MVERLLSTSTYLLLMLSEWGRLLSRPTYLSFDVFSYYKFNTNDVKILYVCHVNTANILHTVYFQFIYTKKNQLNSQTIFSLFIYSVDRIYYSI